MPGRRWKFRIRDILKSIEAIQSYVTGMSVSDFGQDRKTVDAVVYNFVVIGEAAAHVPEEIQTTHDWLPWGEMKAMRNVVVHEYDRVDLATVWKTLQDDLPALAPGLRRILDEAPE